MKIFNSMNVRFTGCFLLIALFFSIKNVQAQNSETNARMHFLKAESLYQKGEYSGALLEVTLADRILSEISPNILYLKCIILDKVARTSFDADFKNNLERSLKLFFENTNKELYPTEKYMEIVKIGSEFKSFKEEDSKLGKRTAFNNEKIGEYLSSSEFTSYRGDILLSYARENVRIEIDSIQDIISELNRDQLPKARRKHKRMVALKVFSWVYFLGATVLLSTQDEELSKGVKLGVAIPFFPAAMFAIWPTVAGSRERLSALSKENDALIRKLDALKYVMKFQHLPDRNTQTFEILMKGLSPN